MNLQLFSCIWNVGIIQDALHGTYNSVPKGLSVPIRLHRENRLLARHRHMGGGIPMGKGNAGNKSGRKDSVREEGLVDLL